MTLLTPVFLLSNSRFCSTHNFANHKGFDSSIYKNNSKPERGEGRPTGKAQQPQLSTSAQKPTLLRRSACPVLKRKWSISI